MYFYVQRRKRVRNSRDSYEFEALADQDASQGLRGGNGDRRGKRRAGELYDAFAGESDEELFSDEEEPETEYKDEGFDQAELNEKASPENAEK